LTARKTLGTVAAVTNAAGWNGSGGRVLFVPVSGARGMGEYARALALATAAARRWPALEAHFALSQQAPYAADTPFPKTLLPSSPTFHTPEMRQLIRAFRPTLVVFDNAGRTAQIKAAAESGARVVYVSSRPRQRRKAFRLAWMRRLDEHWIAYPEFIAGGFGAFEGLKLRVLRRPQVRFLDAILPPADEVLAAVMMEQFSLARGDYALVVPGGGTDHPGAENAPQIVASAARQLADTGVPTVIVGVASSPASGSATAGMLRTSPRIPMAQLAELIRGARVIVSNGGDTLLQAIACAKPCIAVPIAGDQAHRIGKCEQAGLAIGAKLEAAALVREAASLFSDERRRGALVERLAAANVRNGMEVALEAIGRLSAPG
jgi:hypothetical protein